MRCSYHYPSCAANEDPKLTLGNLHEMIALEVQALRFPQQFLLQFCSRHCSQVRAEAFMLSH